MDAETVTRVKREATRRLLALPGVVAVGVGQKVVGDRHTGEPAIKVFVRDKRPLAEVRPDEVIPPSIDGVRTDVVVGGRPVPILEPVETPGVFALSTLTQDLETYRPVEGGGRIITEGACSGGTGGCLLWDKQNHDVGYVLTTFHVVAPPEVDLATAGILKIGQPAGVNVVSGCCNDIVGTYVGGGLTGERDEALVELAPRTKWKARIVDIGLVAGTHTLTHEDIQIAGNPYLVAKRGQRSKVTGGMVTALDATTTEADNLIIVRPNLPTDQGTNTVYFAVAGDSGAALVNEDREVVGLVWARDDIGNAYAYPIGRVLDRLREIDGFDLEVAVSNDPDEVHIVPGGTFTEVPEEIAGRLAADPAERRAFTGTGTRAPLGAPWFSDAIPVPRTVAAVLSDLAASPTGRWLLDLWRDHGTEARGLVDGDRRVMLAWHRGGGAALTQLLLRLPADPARALPATLNGRPLMACVDDVMAALNRAASPGLRDALERARTVLPDLAGLTYPEIIAALDDSAAGTERLTNHG